VNWSSFFSYSYWAQALSPPHSKEGISKALAIAANNQTGNDRGCRTHRVHDAGEPILRSLLRDLSGVRGFGDPPRREADDRQIRLYAAPMTPGRRAAVSSQCS